MIYGIHTIDDFNLTGKTVMVRADMNEPIDWKNNKFRDISRIEASVPTLVELAGKGAKTVLLIHQGSDIEYQNYYNTSLHAEILSDMLGKKIKYIDDVCGPAARDAIKELRTGEILLLDNVRFMAQEQTLFEKNIHLSCEDMLETEVIRKLRPLSDIYLCDAFAAAHRYQPTLCSFPYCMPSGMGRLFEKEYGCLSNLLASSVHPSVFVLGGAKVADAFLIMEKVLENRQADYILTGGLVGNIMLLAVGYEVGLRSREMIERAQGMQFFDKAKRLQQKYSEKILIPEDTAWLEDGVRKEQPAGQYRNEYMAADIGSYTIKKYTQIISQSKNIFINGPMGIFETSGLEKGTREIWQAASRCKGTSVLGGGDSITAAVKFGVKSDFTHISTGGGALIRFLSGEELPVVKALRDGKALFPAGGEK